MHSGKVWKWWRKVSTEKYYIKHDGHTPQPGSAAPTVTVSQYVIAESSTPWSTADLKCEPLRPACRLHS